MGYYRKAVLGLEVFRITSLFPLLLIPFTSHAAGVFNFNTNCKIAYKEIFSLHLDGGKHWIATERAQHPDNLIPLLLESYSDLLKIITSDDKSLLPQLKSAKNDRIGILKKGDQESPWFRYTQAEVQLHYAMAAFQYQEYWSGLMEMRKAYFLLNENKRRYPDFKPNLKSFYTIEALLGAVPEQHAWGLNVLGLKVNRDAMSLMAKLIGEDWGEYDVLREEATHIYIMLLFHLEGNKKRAWEVIQKKGYPIPRNLFSYQAAIKVALFGFHNDDADSLMKETPHGSEYAPLPVLKYYEGLIHLNKLEVQEAIDDFKEFISVTTGANYLKSANQKIAWSYLINGAPAGYKKYMGAVAGIGAEQTEADKQAAKEAKETLHPHPEILKARLLFDGGYFQQSLKTLETIPKETLTDKLYELELVYRKARVLHEMNDTLRAIEGYMVAIGKGKNEPYYYAANAALNLGLIYESKGDKGMAKYYYNMCLEMKDHEYKTSLEQKAKAGLERIKQ